MEAGPAGGAGATRRAAEGPGTLACGKNSSLVLPGRVPFLLASVFLASCGKRSWLHLSLKFLFHFTEGHPIAVSRREKQLSTLSCSLLLSTDGCEERSGGSQRRVLLLQAGGPGDQALSSGGEELLQWEPVQVLPDAAAPGQG